MLTLVAFMLEEKNMKIFCNSSHSFCYQMWCPQKPQLLQYLNNKHPDNQELTICNKPYIYIGYMYKSVCYRISVIIGNTSNDQKHKVTFTFKTKERKKERKEERKLF